MNNLSDDIAGLSPGQRELVQSRLRLRAVMDAGHPQPLPLSLAQERVWFLHHLADDPGNLNTPVAVRIRGPLQVPVLESCLDEIVRRHEVLRTRFDLLDGAPAAVLEPLVQPLLAIVDLHPLPTAVREQRAHDLAIEAARQPFDLKTAPLLRGLLVKLDARDFLLVLVLHHIVSDRWTVGVLLREIAALYDRDAGASGRALPAPKLQYADYARWQRRKLQEGSALQSAQYWREQLRGASEPDNLGGGRRCARKGSGRVSQRLPSAFFDRLSAFGRGERATLFMANLAVFAAVLHRYGQRPDFVIGTPLVQRQLPGTESLIGCFLNLLPIKADFSDDPSFRQLLARVRRTCLEAFSHGDYPVHLVLRELAVEGAPLGSSVLFVHNDTYDVMMAGQALAETLDAAHLEMTPVDIYGGGAQGNLVLTVDRRSGGSTCAVEFRHSHLTECEASRILSHFMRLLESALEFPDRPLSTLPMLPAEELHRTLIELNNVRPLAPAGLTIHELLTAQALRSPDAIALECGETRVSYAGLMKRSGLLASRLRDLGVELEEPVAVVTPRGIDRIVAMVAILCCGATYVPLEISDPPARRADLLGRSNVKILLTTRGCFERMAWPHHLTVCIDDPPDAQLRPPRAVPQDALACIMFTSGSTGSPKGVTATHRSIVQLVHGADYLHFGPEEVFLHFAPVAFDASTFEIWGALLNGARLVIAPAEVDSLQQLGDVVARYGVTTLWLTTGLFHEMVTEGLPALAGVRQLVTGGDVLSGAKAHAVIRELPGCRLIHAYGPTECTTFSTTCVLAENLIADTVPIGRPINGARAYVLDLHLQPVASGVVGELYVGGDGLSRGYNLEPAATAARFIPDPFGAAGSRLYRTGDLARWNSRGYLEFVGRIDRQVKIRGFRVSPAEVEATLAQHPLVNEAVVDAEGDPGDRRLAAYLVPRSAESTAAEIRDYMAERLPASAVPSAFIFVEAIPRTPIGKPDRAALSAQPRRQADPRPAASTLERELLTIWNDVLQRQDIGTEDDFFLLGGHSLLGLRLIARVRGRLGVDLSLRELFDAPTIAGQARQIVSRGEGTLVRSPIITVEPDPARMLDPFPLTEVQRAYWVGRMSSLPFGNVSSQIYLELEFDDLDLDRVEEILQILVVRHLMLRAFVRADGLQQIAAELPGSLLSRHDLSEAADEVIATHLASLRQRMSQQVLPADQPPLFEICASRLPGAVRLHISIDAMISDASSLRVVAAEFDLLYRDRTARLTDLPVSFRDWVIAAQARRSKDHTRAWDHWKNRLATLPEPPGLPLQFTAGSERPSFKRVQLRFDCERWSRLHRAAGETGLTPSVLLLAAFARIVAAWSRQPRFLLKLTLFNRPPDHSELNRIVGDFTSVTLLACDQLAGETFADGALRLQRRLWEDLDHRDISAIEVLRELMPGQAAHLAPVVFTSLLGLEQVPQSERLRGRIVHAISQTPQVWIDHQVHEEQGELVSTWDHVEGIFPPGVIEAMADAFRASLVRLSDARDDWNRKWFQPWAQRRQVMPEAPEAAHSPASEPLHEAFFRRAAASRSAPALVTPAVTLSYGELAERARALAGDLAERGIGEEQLVAVMMDKGWEQVIAVIGVLAAGAAYVPIDPALPASRIRDLLAQARVSAVLVQSGARSLSGLTDASVVVLDREPNSGAMPLPARPSSAHLAYVIFTSGTTGVPKGVMIEHGAAVNTIADVNRRCRLGPCDRVFAASSLSFDLSVWDIFGVLSAGAALVFPRADAAMDPAHWLEVVSAQRVTVWNSVPTLASLLGEEAQRRGISCPGLRCFLLSGDVIPPALPVRLRGWNPGSRVVAMGGATEAAIWSVWHDIEEKESGSIPYGKPLANQTVEVLDDDLEPRPAFVAGQIWIGGAGLARGYWNDPVRTADCFLPAPGGARLYRTGDLGAPRPDGTIEFLGRRDGQVKLHGQRVELGEVESVLRENPNVREAVAVLHGTGATAGLVAYVTTSNDVRSDELRAFLTRRIARHMVPMIVPLDVLPTGPNGKVDRRALSLRALPRRSERSGGATPTEEILAGIWRDLLGIDAVSRHDDFFALGGQSVLAIRLVSQIREAFGIELPLADVFEYPQLARLAERIDLGDQPSLTPLPALAQAGGRLSFGEEMLWFLDRWVPDSAAYVMPMAVQLLGPLDPGLLERALNELVRRHAILRTVYSTQDGAPAASTLEDRGVELARYTARDLEDAREIAASIAQTPMNLETGPLFRSALVQFGADKQVLIVTVHHIVADGWSLALMLRETAAVYGMLRHGEALPATAPSHEYRRYAAWQGKAVGEAGLQRQLDYWREQLRGAAAVLTLPADRIRPNKPSFRGAHLELEFEPHHVAALDALARGERATTFMAVLALFGLVLAKQSGESDLLVGTPVANRRRADMEGVIGFFANTIPLRLNLAGNCNFRDFLRRVKDVALKAYANQDMPFERLVRELKPRRVPGAQPLIQAMLVFQDALLDAGSWPGLQLLPLEFGTKFAHFDLTLRMWRSGDRLRGRFEYSVDLFDAATIARLRDALQGALALVARRPDLALADVDLASDAERHARKLEWQGAALPRQPAVVDRVAECARRTPNAIAVRSGGVALSFAELMARAEKLAARLAPLLERRRELVAVSLPRSIDFVIAVLAIWRSDASYLPLDPFESDARRAYLLQAASARLLLSSDPNEPDGIEIRQCGPVAAHGPRGTMVGPSPDDAAYVIFTSGSTGDPKAAVMTHGNVAAYVEAMGRVLGILNTDVYLHTAPFSFSASVRQLFVPIAHGASVSIADERDVPDPDRLLECLARDGASILDLVPSHWRALLAWIETRAASHGSKTDTVRLVLSASEALTSDIVERWRASFPAARRLNLYGQTETTGIVCSSAVPASAESSLAVGRPIPGTLACILDDAFRPVPVGRTGELFIGGANVGRGYLGQPALTAERFVPDAFGSAPGGRLYATGDLARRRADGKIEIVGRRDQQTKINGHRVEPAEIEACLLAHPCVRETVVVPTRSPGGDTSLVAHVVARSPVTVDELRTALAARLPSYMLPRIRLIDALPRTRTGKIDRAGLARADENAGPRPAAETPVEAAVVEIVREVLGGEPSAQDSFFAIGGHSLAAIKVIARIAARLGVHLPVHVIFEVQSLAELAQRVSAPSPMPGGVAKAIGRGPRDQPQFASFGQKRLFALQEIEPDSMAYTVPAVLRLRGRLDRLALQRSLTEIQRRHDILRATFSMRDGEVLVLANDCTADLAQEDFRLSARPEHAARMWVESILREPFDLCRGPVLRTGLARLADDDAILVVVAHHIVTDGWSNAIFFSELAALYDAFSYDRPSPLDPPALQYADYAGWQRTQLGGARGAALRAYWSEYLRDAPVETAFPPDRPRPALRKADGETRSILLSHEVRLAVEQFALAHRVTPFVVLLAAYQLLLAQSSEARDVVVGVPVAGRGRQEAENMIGFFVNTLAVRTRIPAASNFRDLLRSVQESLATLLAHDDMPFEEILELVKPERRLDRTPVFQTAFAYQNVPAAEPRLAGLEVAPLKWGSTVAKFDLTIAVRPVERGLALSAEFDRALFDGNTIDRLLDSYGGLLDGVLQRPDADMFAIGLHSSGLRHGLLVEWSGGQASEFEFSSVADLVVAAASRDGGAVAVCDEWGELSYAELDGLSNALGSRLRASGVGCETRVALVMERSRWLAVSALAVLKAGGAFVALDPWQPQERVNWQIADAGAVVVLTDEATRRRLQLEAGQLLSVDRLGLAGTGPAVSSAVVPDQLAYVIYTSGTTGRPKGVGVPHRGLTNLVRWHVRRYGLNAGDVSGHVAGLGFDASVWELWPVLAAGGRLEMADAQARSTAEGLRDWLVARGVTTTFVPTGLAEEVLRGPRPEGLRLRRMLVGGERLYEAGGEWGIEVINHYGPTEASVVATAGRVKAGERQPSIGRPIDGMRVRVLADGGGVVGPGVAGELYIGGAGLARGYLGRAAETALRFVPDPFGNGERLYRTGDRVKWGWDGRLHYLGRADDQVKIRGQRVEPGELEGMLRSHPAVREAAAVSVGEGGATQLLAYVVSGAGERELQGWLAERVAAALLPARIVGLEHLPRSANGKVDRDWLRRQPLPETAEPSAPPVGELEHMLVKLWASVLGRSDFGRHDNFFALGGDSLRALHVVTRARSNGLHLTARDIFQCPTVSTLALVVKAVGSSQQELATALAVAPPTPIQAWLLGYPQPEINHWNQSLLIPLDGEVDRGRLQTALNALVDRHDALRLRVRGREQDWQISAAAPGIQVPLETVDVAREDMEARLHAAQRGLDLADGPIIRAILVSGAGHPWLFLAIHHIAVDVVSWRIIADDLLALYRGAPATIRRSSMSFLRYAAELSSRARSAEILAEKDFWLRQCEAVTRLPIDADGRNTEDSSEVLSRVLDTGQTNAIRACVDSLGGTLQSATLAALGHAISEWTGSSAQSFNVETHGRDLEAPEGGMVGWMTSLFPIAVDCSADSRTTTTRVARTLKDLPGGGAGWGLLRYARRDAVARELAGLPEPQILFNFLGNVDPRSQAPWDAGPMRGGRNLRWHLLEVTALIEAGRLRILLGYSRAVHRPQTAQAILSRAVEILGGLVATPPIEKTGIEQVYPVTSLQHGMLFHTLHSPGTYIAQVTCRLEGDLPPEWLAQAWAAVIDRHPALRIAFSLDQVAPVQNVRDNAILPITNLDWRSSPADDEDPRTERLLAHDRALGFDLSRAPLMRLTVVRTAEHRQLMIWTYHHAILDGWSMGLVLKDVLAAVGQLRNGRQPAFPPAPPLRAYFDWLGTRDSTAAETFWRDKLGRASPTPLPFDRRSRSGETGLDELRVVLCREESEMIRLGAAAARVSVATLVHAAWALALGRVGGETEVMFGVTVSGRPDEIPDAENLVGMFIRTIPYCVSVPRGMAVGEWLRDCQALFWQARQFEYASLVKMHEWSALPPQVPLFETIVVVENYPLPSEAGVRPGALRLRDLRVIDRPDVPVIFSVIPGAQSELVLAYDLSRLDARHARTLLDMARHALAALAANAGRPVGEIRLSRPTPRQGSSNGGSLGSAEFRPAEEAGSLFSMIARWAMQTPDQPAIVQGAETVSYARMHALAGALAQRLRRLGVQRDCRVGIQLPRSPALLIAALGVLYAGGAYVPIDPALPRRRIAAILSHAEITVLLCCAARTARDDEPWVNLIFDPASLDLLGEAGASDLEDVMCSPAAAYVVYTSGSSGAPRGVVVENRGLAALARSLIERYSLSPHDRVLQLASPAFDVFAEEVFPTLAAGAAIILPPRDEPVAPGDLAGLVTEQGVTVLNLSSSYFHAWVRELTRQPASTNGLRLVVTGSEPVHPSRLSEWENLAPAKWLHAYGTTEAVVTSTVFEGSAERDVIPLGLPLGHVETYLVDRSLRMVDPGHVGELCIGGEGIARGYLRNPVDTASRFIPDPFALKPGSRMVRTGDLARRTLKGDLEFVGRADALIKRLGRRIDCNEIERALMGHPLVDEAIVGLLGDDKLTAVFTASARIPEQRELARFLRASLPAAWIPGEFLHVPALPRLAGGKIARNGLEALADRASKLEVPKQPPRDQIEREICALWAEQVAPPQSIADDFFAVGGDSLRALQFVSRVRARFGTGPSLAEFASDPTVEAVARRVKAAGNLDSPVLVPLSVGAREPALFVVHAGDGGVTSYRALADAIAGRYSVYGLHSAILKDIDLAAASIETAAGAYIGIIRQAQPTGPYAIGGWSLGGLLAQAIASALERNGEQVTLVLIDPPSPASLEAVRGNGSSKAKDDEAFGLATALPTSIPAQDDELGPWRSVYSRILSSAASSELPKFGGRAVLYQAQRGEASVRVLARESFAAACCSMTARVLPGDHYSMLMPPYVAALAQTLRHDLLRPINGDLKP
ncbi:non-ribosomal peptide synthetase [Bradyrhizobium japonicum]|uniref:non-ribosomal peptide synthetase n=1 Tax=Bradyrhizobium japonicum TaxID=375 RepID=UPI00209CC4EA|nr:non-ribosomal peptide synthetase [Bradyrhizobium japonicum]MCP1749196.1 amino acid adenylation domain-containing protein/non-ribosomal peptide synthase protein (TIGR01720 family) [Bradyrhizobium japonicum]MCP1855152.1 amino acid adenylation domain-containing protein/non-ribosomal peptide synthase protein (TIGR01720 family) [Bradyrhizobium japonicum]MCP1897807.1 amino acid adenylation domain-containing protein/non-ribosomal peptide synthase protein (TIGR01720 family) [Bradyrhizobium japonicum]